MFDFTGASVSVSLQLNGSKFGNHMQSMCDR